jgi:hypothetical protein
VPEGKLLILVPIFFLTPLYLDLIMAWPRGQPAVVLPTILDFISANAAAIRAKADLILFSMPRSSNCTLGAEQKSVLGEAKSRPNPLHCDFREGVRIVRGPNILGGIDPTGSEERPELGLRRLLSVR